jgi:hypothetical protein
MARVYLETSFVSACVTTRTDVASIYWRQTSLEWWTTQASRHQVVISAEVLEELDNPIYPNREAALAFVREVPSLSPNPAAAQLAQHFVDQFVMPGPIAGDAMHVAIACVSQIEFILSWNVKHLANPRKTAHLRSVCAKLGLVPPHIVTPDLLWE